MEDLSILSHLFKELAKEEKGLRGIQPVYSATYEHVANGIYSIDAIQKGINND